MILGSEIFERIQQIHNSLNPEAVKRQEAEDYVLKEGRGTCMYCKEEIIKNEHMMGGGWIWESESLVGLCAGPGSKDRKHKPMLRYSLEEGIHNAQKSDP